MDPFVFHGGRLGEARRRFAWAPAPWIDLSTGINPRPYPAPAAGPDARGRLPDPEETAALEIAAARAFGVAPEAVLATPGAEAAIRLLARGLSAWSVGIVGPTYRGHAEAWRDAGAQVTEIGRGDLADAAGAFDVVVVVNPNNPDGAVTAPESLAVLAGAMGARHGWLIVDEAFGEVNPEASVAGLVAASAGLLVLRSFGKFYGLPGLRLGFVVARPGFVERLRRLQGEWPVSADAIAAGRLAYGDDGWADDMRRGLARDAARLDVSLIASGFEIAGGTSLFRLAAADDAAARFIRLAKAGVLTRPFDHEPRWLRFGLPAPEHWPRLDAALLESAS